MFGNYPASRWLVVGLSVGEEEGKQPFRLIQWHLLWQGKRAGRQATRRKANMANGGEIGRYQDQTGITTAVCFLENPFYPSHVHLFTIQRLNSPRRLLMDQKSCYQITVTTRVTLPPQWLFFSWVWIWMGKYHKKLFSQFYLGRSRTKAPLLAEYAISCLNKTLPLAKSKIKTF